MLTNTFAIACHPLGH